MNNQPEIMLIWTLGEELLNPKISVEDPPLKWLRSKSL